MDLSKIRLVDHRIGDLIRPVLNVTEHDIKMEDARKIGVFMCPPGGLPIKAESLDYVWSITRGVTLFRGVFSPIKRYDDILNELYARYQDLVVFGNQIQTLAYPEKVFGMRLSKNKSLCDRFGVRVISSSEFNVYPSGTPRVVALLPGSTIQG